MVYEEEEGVQVVKVEMHKNIVQRAVEQVVRVLKVECVEEIVQAPRVEVQEKIVQRAVDHFYISSLILISEPDLNNPA